MSESRVVLDADFINLITDIRDSDPADLFKRIFAALAKTPVVHPYVAQHELHSNKVAQALITSGDLLVIEKDSFLPPGDTFMQAHYKLNSYDIYNVITKDPLPFLGDIWQNRAGNNFGEIHSVLMAADLGLPLFYSNDGGAKQAATYYASGLLDVVNAAELADNLTEVATITGKERRYLKKYKERAKHERQLSACRQIFAFHIGSVKKQPNEMR